MDLRGIEFELADPQYVVQILDHISSIAHSMDDEIESITDNTSLMELQKNMQYLLRIQFVFISKMETKFEEMGFDMNV